KHAKLNNELTADVCIIGGGFTGLSAALHLAEQGKDVVLLEAEKISWGASGRNGGHVGTGQRKGQEDLEKRYGMDIAQKLWSLGFDSADLVRNLIEKHQIQCELKQGILQLAAKKRDVDYMRQSAAKLQNDYGYEHVRFIEKDEVDQMVGTSNYFAGQLDSASYHLHPLKYALGLADAAMKAGARLFEHSRVTSYKQDIKTSEVVVHTDSGRVKAKTLVLACNGYLGNLVPKMAGKIMPINNFVMATEPLGEELAKQLVRDDVAVQDSLFVLNYWKLSEDNRLIFGGGENYTNKFPTDIKSFVRQYLLKIYPQLESTAIEYGWGGTLAITLNRMPDYGKLDSNIYYAQGYSGHGVPTATMAGKLLAEEICGGSERFKLISKLPTPGFPGGTLLRWPGLVAGMLYHVLLDKI
ncbi:MAG: gamma-glutamylputrescine oxidase, partial [Enterobacterales bacterium]